MKNQKRHLGKAGASLPLVLCVIAFLIAFSLALTYAASLLLSRTNVKIEEQRCYQLACSFAAQLDAQLTNTTTSSGDGSSGSGVSFKTFVNNFLTNVQYVDYNEEKGTGIYTYETSNETDGYGKITVKLYKETTMTDKDMAAYNGTLNVMETTNATYTEQVSIINKRTFDRYAVTVEVIAECDDLTYSYKTEYVRTDTYNVIFKDGETVIVWNEKDNKWYEGTKDSSAIHNFTDTTSISYAYQYQNSTTPLTVTYTPAHAAYTAAPDESEP